MISMTDAAVRWHLAPAHQSMVDPPAAPARLPRPDLTELRRRLEVAQQEHAALRVRREAAVPVVGASSSFCDWKFPSGLALGGSAYMGLGWGSDSLAFQATFYTAGGCCLCCAAGCATGLVMQADADRRNLAANPTDEELAAAESTVVERQAELDLAHAVEIMSSLSAPNGPDIVRLVLAYAQPLPPNAPAPAT